MCRWTTGEQLIIFTRDRLIGEIGQYYYRHRIYHAQLGRFVSRDWVFSDVNSYRYVRNNPLSARDPSGNCAIEEKEDFCGPEMLPSLVMTLGSVISDIRGIGFLNREFPVFWPWDIQFPVNEIAGCPTSGCADCITINGIKQRSWDVNYVLFGCLLQETDSSVQDGLNLAWLWKNAKGIGNEYTCQLERWIWIGVSVHGDHAL